jgi:hypothetical protein
MGESLGRFLSGRFRPSPGVAKSPSIVEWERKSNLPKAEIKVSILILRPPGTGVRDSILHGASYDLAAAVRPILGLQRLLLTPYKFIGLGAIDVTKPHKFVWVW